MIIMHCILFDLAELEPSVLAIISRWKINTLKFLHPNKFKSNLMLFSSVVTVLKIW